MTRTLLVEDSDTFRRTLRSLLSPRFPSMIFEEAKDSTEAFEKITSFDPQLIFMDIKLPGENGLAITKKIRQAHCQATVIILTSYDLPEYREAAIRNGAHYFISKGSTTTEELLELVERVISGEASDGHC
jgi:DNA-binding NarL/FixJ family response regulator